jgi:hypothetical protein
MREARGRAGGTQATSVEVYVYFRSDPAKAAEVLAALARQRALFEQAGHGGLRTGLRRESGPKDYLTWLEVYRFEAGGGGGAGAAVRGAAFQAGLETGLETGLEAGLEAIERCARDSGLAALALQGRHREVFELTG